MPDGAYRVQFPKESVSVIERMSEALRQSDHVAEQQIAGYVVNLHRGEEEEHGVVTVRMETGKIRRNVKMRLEPADYRQAALAHDERRPVLVRGTLRRESGRALWMTDIRGFGFAQLVDYRLLT